MTAERLVVIFEGKSADMCGGKFSLVSVGVQAECPARADKGARNPSGLAEILLVVTVIAFGLEIMA